MNGKVTDAAIQQWAEKHGLTSRTIREAYEEAARQPAKPEAVRLRDELRERAAFEALAESLRQIADAQYTRRQRFNGRLPADVQDVIRMAADALAATGKQQVGELPDGMVTIQISDAKALCAYVAHSPRSALAARRVAELIGERDARNTDV